MHGTVDLIAWGWPYLDLHVWKDEPSRWLGRRHRVERHDWYWNYGKLWTARQPLPDWMQDNIRGMDDPWFADEFMAGLTHDEWDRLWNGFAPVKRRQAEAFFASVLLSPRALREWAGVDVVNGRILRELQGRKWWEDCPDLPAAYARLVRYAEITWRMQGRHPLGSTLRAIRRRGPSRP